jgi:hypothetical protein
VFGSFEIGKFHLWKFPRIFTKVTGWSNLEVSNLENLEVPAVTCVTKQGIRLPSTCSVVHPSPVASLSEDTYATKYMCDPPDALSYQDARQAEKKLTMENVVRWVDRFDRHRGRLRFFADLTPTPYFQLVAKPLLSIKTTGSISVERVAKPLKNKVATQERNRLSTDKRTLLLRAGLNLRLKRESLRSTKAGLGKVDLDNAFVYE